MRRFKSGARVIVYSTRGIGRAKPRGGTVLATYPRFVLVEVRGEGGGGQAGSWRECFFPEEVRRE